MLNVDNGKMVNTGSDRLSYIYIYILNWINLNSLLCVRKYKLEWYCSYCASSRTSHIIYKGIELAVLAVFMLWVQLWWWPMTRLWKFTVTGSPVLRMLCLLELQWQTHTYCINQVTTPAVSVGTRESHCLESTNVVGAITVQLDFCIPEKLRPWGKHQAHFRG